MYIIDKTNRNSRERVSRGFDFAELAREAKTNKDPKAREAAKDAMDKLRKEDKNVRAMREALVKAHRSGNREEVKDIHDIVQHKRKYRHE